MYLFKRSIYQEALNIRRYGILETLIDMGDCMPSDRDLTCRKVTEVVQKPSTG